MVMEVCTPCALWLGCAGDTAGWVVVGGHCGWSCGSVSVAVEEWSDEVWLVLGVLSYGVSGAGSM